MQKTLTLTTTEPGEEQELDAALHALDFLLVISNVLNSLRATVKYSSNPDEIRLAEKMREIIHKEIEEYNLERFFC